MKKKKILKLVNEARITLTDCFIRYLKQKEINKELVEENEALKTQIREYERKLHNTFNPAPSSDTSVTED